VAQEFTSGDPLVAFGEDLRVTAWNKAAEELTGIPEEEALGRRCWELIGAVDERGDLVCHAGCSNARLAAKGWPVSEQRLQVKTAEGRKLVSVSTIAVRNGTPPTFLHVMRNGVSEPPPPPPVEEPTGKPVTLTARQLEVLELLGAGKPAKVISASLGISETTVRNHIRMILLELGCHSQLQAVAEARRRGLLA
jgi:PAS domain S-box-containing protein